MRYLFAVMTLALTTAVAGPSAEAADKVGAVSRVQGSCTGSIEGAISALATSLPIFLEELIMTGAMARVEVGFNDGSILTVGARASVTVDRFVYHPGGLGSDFVAAVVGPFRFVSSQIAKVATRRRIVQTPAATIVLRGTDFFAGPIDGQFGVLLLEGAVDVINPAGTAALRRPGEGTNIAAIGAPPGPVTIWPADKVARALASVAFQ